jgi:hypothetical protein
VNPRNGDDLDHDPLLAGRGDPHPEFPDLIADVADPLSVHGWVVGQ